MIPLFFMICFNVGEQLEYSAKYGFLNIGTMTLEIVDTMTYQTKRCYRIVSKLKSSSSLGFIFTLNDTVEVYTTEDSLLPVYYEENLNEGKYHSRSRLAFNQESLFVVYDDTLRLAIKECSRDLLSFWYYLRTIPLVENDTFKLNVHKSKETHEIECFVYKKEKIKTNLGEFQAIRVAPQAQGKGIFGKKGSMEIWYADDSTRYPLQIKTRFKYGSIVFKLKNVKN